MDGVLGAETQFLSELTCNRENSNRWLELRALMESWLMAVDHVGRHPGSWSYIQGSTRNHENEWKTNNLGCMLYSVYAVLGGNSWSWQGEIGRDNSTLCSVMMIELWTRKRGMGMKMRMMWRIRAGLRNQGYDLPDWVGKTSYLGNYTPDRDLYLPNRRW